MSSTQIFAKRLKEARQGKGWSQTELAKAANTTATTVSKYEAGNETSKPSLELAVSFAQVLGVSLDWLCGIEQNTEKANRITDFDVKSYLYSLVRIVTELSTDIKTEGVKLGGENAVSITIPNNVIGSFIVKVSDLLKVYRAGSLTEDLYITCIDKIVNDYSDYVFEYDRFLSSEQAADCYCTVLNAIDTFEDFSSGVITFRLKENSETSKFYISERTLEEIQKSYDEF